MTVTQKQCLLCYLGYYQGPIDGKFGPASKEATRAFQADYGLEVDGSFGPLTEEKILQAVAGTAQKVEKADFWTEIKHFRKDEFKCKCGGKYCDGFPAEPSETLIRVADRVREHFGARCNVSSGVRCEVHNKAVGGVSGSRHKLGKAMDFCISGMSAASVLPYVQAQSEIRYAYAIDSHYVHMDVL